MLAVLVQVTSPSCRFGGAADGLVLVLVVLALVLTLVISSSC